MIVRIWTGRTPAQKAAAYRELMETVALPHYQRTPGNRAAYCLTREEGEVVEFKMLTFWDSLDAIKAFAGPFVDKAHYYDFDAQYLSDFPERVEHFVCADHDDR